MRGLGVSGKVRTSVALCCRGVRVYRGAVISQFLRVLAIWRCPVVVGPIVCVRRVLWPRRCPTCAARCCVGRCSLFPGSFNPFLLVVGGLRSPNISRNHWVSLMNTKRCLNIFGFDYSFGRSLLALPAACSRW